MKVNTSPRLPSPARLKELFTYMPETGEFLRNATNRRWKAGSPAGCIDPHSGYLLIRVDGILLRANRMAVAMVEGEWPPGLVDHEDRDRGNNRWVNLRKATVSHNQQNKKVQCNNKTGFKGVFQQKSGRFVAYITHERKRKHLGVFDELADAAKAYSEAKARLHTFHPGVA